MTVRFCVGDKLINPNEYYEKVAAGEFSKFLGRRGGIVTFKW